MKARSGCSRRRREGVGDDPKRDFLQVEKDAWNGRKRIGDIPVKVVTAKPLAEAIKELPFPSERRAIRNNVRDQKAGSSSALGRRRSWPTAATRWKRKTRGSSSTQSSMR
jgi:hypothetical protein